MWDHLRSQSKLDLAPIAYSCQQSYLGFIMSFTYPTFESILLILLMFYVHPSWKCKRIYLMRRFRSRLLIERSRFCAPKSFLGSKSSGRIMASRKLPGKEKRICAPDIHISSRQVRILFSRTKILKWGRVVIPVLKKLIKIY